jgi:alpha-ketoglutarate-dependent taurine dioxygenase
VAILEKAGLAYRKSKPEIGAVLQAERQALLDGSHARTIRELLDECGVLVFPKVHFTEAEQIAFTRTLGEYAADHADGRATAINIDPAGGILAEYTKASFFWHFDGYFNEVPILGSLLCCEVPAPSGGDTEFCNTHAAYAVHALAGAQRSIEPEPSYATFQNWLRIRPARLPLVWTHRSGRKSLIIGNTTVGIVGMDPLDSLELMTWLRDWATQERFAYRHSWSAGDAVLWDNTGTLHRVTPYDPSCGRSRRRTKIAGEEPFA